MVRDNLWSKASELAARDYKLEYEWDELADGSPVVMAINPELPGCMAQGATEEEAREELREARQEYIYSLLEDELHVPEPEILATSVSGNPFERTLIAVWFPMENNRIEIGDIREESLDYLTNEIVLKKNLVPA